MRRVNRGLRVGLRAEGLEARRLLAVSASYLGLSDLDFAGPTASIGPGGLRNLEVRVNLPIDANGQAAALRSVNISGPGGTRWSYGDPTRADAAIVVVAEPYSAGDASRAFDLFLSPSVLVVDAATGVSSQVTLPHDQFAPTSIGFDPITGKLIPPVPVNVSKLQLDVSYVDGTGATTRESWSSNTSLVVAVNDLDGKALADRPPEAPTFGFGSYPTTYTGQGADGRGRITVSGLPTGSTLDPSSLVLTDVAGQYWSYGSTGGRWELGTGLSYSADHTTATIDFPPLRDESGTAMTLAYRINGDTTQYLTDVAIPANSGMNPNLRDGGPVNPLSSVLTVYPTSAATPNMVSYVDGANLTHVVDIQNLLNGGSPYHNITLATGTTGGVYTLDKRLDFRNPVIFKAASPDVTLNFTFSTVVQAALNLYSSHVTLDGFKVRFEKPSVDFTFNGWSDATSVAIISNRQDNGQVPHVDLNVLNLDIQAPAVPFGPNPADNGAINTISTFDTGPYSSGVFSGNTIYGGSVMLQGGPWTVTNNQVRGAVAGTVSNGAFALYLAHDVLVSGNTVTNRNADLSSTSGPKTGAIDRFLTANNGSYQVVVTGNTVTDHIGLIPANPGGYSEGNPRNSPEIMVFEGYGKTFEGNIAATRVSSSSATSYDRRVVTIANSQTDRFAPGAGPLVLVILNGPMAGTSIPVGQAIVGATSSSFVLTSSLPTGDFDFSLVASHNHLEITDNTIDVRGTISTGLVLSDTILNAKVTGNTFLGDGTILRDGNGNFLTSQAIRYEVFVKYDDRAGNLYLPIDATIANNTIIDALGGVRIYVERGFAASYGRTYGFLQFHDNAFSYSYPNPSIVSTQFVDSYAQVVNGSMVPDAAATRFLDAGTIRISSANNTVEWVGIDTPSSYTTISSVTINGVAYGKQVSHPIDPLVTTLLKPATAPVPPPSTPPAGTPPNGSNNNGMNAPGVLLIPEGGETSAGSGNLAVNPGSLLAPPSDDLLSGILVPLPITIPLESLPNADASIETQPESIDTPAPGELVGDVGVISSTTDTGAQPGEGKPIRLGFLTAAGTQSGSWRDLWFAPKRRGALRLLIPSRLLPARLRGKTAPVLKEASVKHRLASK